METIVQKLPNWLKLIDTQEGKILKMDRNFTMIQVHSGLKNN